MGAAATVSSAVTRADSPDVVEAVRRALDAARDGDAAARRIAAQLLVGFLDDEQVEPAYGATLRAVVAQLG